MMWRAVTMMVMEVGSWKLDPGPPEPPVPINLHLSLLLLFLPSSLRELDLNSF
jgi:hypothetical protein